MGTAGWTRARLTWRNGPGGRTSGTMGERHMASQVVRGWWMAAPAVVTLVLVVGCHRSEGVLLSGPCVYLIEGAADEDSDGLSLIRDELEGHRVKARLYGPDNWLSIIADIDAAPHEEVILVGHGHGAFLATQVVRHYAQRHKMKFIDAVITLDPFNKDWPHNAWERGEERPRCRPMSIPVGHNAIKVRNYTQQSADSLRWGSDLVSTRASNVAPEHPYYWYDDFWNRRPVTGQYLAEEIFTEGVRHETIDNDQALLHRIILMCRQAALSPYHYTPPAHHPDVEKKTKPQPAPRRAIEAT
jgi:pimeloyl-ACP methyl ester carboxylesterase